MGRGLNCLQNGSSANLSNSNSIHSSFYGTYLCPVSCARVLAVCSPWYLFTLATVLDEHIPPWRARPDKKISIFIDYITVMLKDFLHFNLERKSPDKSDAQSIFTPVVTVGT